MPAGATAPTTVNRRRRSRWLSGAVGAAAAVGLAAVLLSGGFDRLTTSPRPGHPAAVQPGGPRAASGDGDTVACRPTACTQSGRPVAAPIEGGACQRASGAAAWTRIDRHAPEPLLICLPQRPPAAGVAPVAAVPSLAGAQLDRAELALDRLGIGHDTSGGGLLGILDRGAWTVCATSPPSGARLVAAARVKLFVDRSC